MSSPKVLTAELSVSEQLTLEDMKMLAEAGFKTVINNRPEGEAADQPDEADLAHAAQQAGLRYIYLPITPGDFNAQAVAAFARYLDTEAKPILAFCRTGTRSTTLWALSQAGKKAPAEIIDSAAQAGYDLSKLADRL